MASLLLFTLFSSATLWIAESTKQDYDCPMRQLAMDFAQEIQPWLVKDQLQDLADALNGAPESENCDIKPPNIANKHRSAPIWNDINIDNKQTITFYVDYNDGDDNNDGSKPSPFKNLQKAVITARNRFGPNILKKIILRKGTHYLPNTIYFTEQDSNLLITNYDGESVKISGGKKINCNWKLYKNGTNNKNIYQCSINDNNITDILGLRVNTMRAIRARYPNANPELGFGSTLLPLKFLPPTLPKEPDFVIYPDEPVRNNTQGGYFEHYNLGFGGPCEIFTPPAGYWCSDKTQGGGPALFTLPSGITYNSSILPNAPYQDTSTMIIQMWRAAHWASWMFDVAEYDAGKKEIIFGRGGFQGARGHQTGQEFYVESVMEELDVPSEWFYNKKSRVLYYYNNETGSNSINNLLFEVTNLKVLFNFTGTMSKPVKNVEIRGMNYSDTMLTYMDDHGMPSGGDWALQRTGAIYLDGVEDVMIQQNYFSRMDGNVISINRYARNVTVYRNEIVWNGDNVISNWGDTQGISFPDSPTQFGVDGTAGNQPRGILVSGNFVHEIGIWEKQSSMYFQAQSCSNIIYENIFFNGPRAGVNFNDGFGGNSTVAKNLLFNTCRESGDHGPFNSWDRQVYITKVATGEESVYKQYDYIYKNFMISNYNAGEGVDNDDGSAFYKTYENFISYGSNALKSGHGGNSNHVYNNIHAYIENGWNTCFDITRGGTGQLAGYIDMYSNNTCVFADDVKNYGVFNCSAPMDAWPTLGNNTIHKVNGDKSATGLCGMTEDEFQKKYSRDLGTVILGPANDTQLLMQARNMLFS